MRVIALSAALLLALIGATATADMVPLQNIGPTTGPYRWQCAATGFADESHVVGACMERYYSAGSGRGGGYRAPTLLGTWLVTWDFSGVPTLDKSQSVPWPGCGTDATITIDGATYYYIGADSTGHELVETNACQSYLVPQ